MKSPFVLETNGLLIGRMSELAEMLKGLPIFVKVAVKGWNEKSFEKIKRAMSSAFRYKLKALDELSRRGIKVWPAIMILGVVDVFGEDGARQINEMLAGVGFEAETEELNRYPVVMKNLKKRGVEVKIS